MLKQFLLVSAICFATQTSAKLDTLPEEFSDFSLDRDITISYDDLDMLLDMTVIDLGRSDRRFRKSKANIGTRMRAHKNNDTALEANRFFYEEVTTSKLKEGFHKVRVSLEKVPDQVPLNALVLDEQLAYWLNLYTTALLEKLIEHYPVIDTQELLFGEQSILDEEFIHVAGYQLSLNDIQHNIVFKKFGKNKPIVMYGFHQGNIGSPNLRKEAYKGSEVYHQLVENGEEFVNSNRGMQVKGNNKLYLSLYYKQVEALFDDFENQLKNHIEDYTEGDLKNSVELADNFQLSIDDWGINDLYRTERTFGASTATNRAALLNAVASASGDVGVGAVNSSYISDAFMERTVEFGRFPPEVWEKLKQLNTKRKENRGSVKIKDLDANQE
ncbi:DUF547 domain-containing protein [Pseudoalteromonas gelatinilytica]